MSALMVQDRDGGKHSTSPHRRVITRLCQL